MAMSAYLVSKAALVTNVAELALVVTAVRVLAISRAAFRYLERYATHAATLRILADLRVWLYASIEPLAPARLDEDAAAGDVLARLVADVDTLEDFSVRVVLPPIVAVLTTLFASLLLGAFDAQPRASCCSRSSSLTGVVLPLATRRLSRRRGRRVDRDPVRAPRIRHRRHRGHGRPARARSGRLAPGAGARARRARSTGWAIGWPSSAAWAAGSRPA